jgi:hypothetical protein
MASKTKKTKAIRARKHAPNPINLKVDRKRTAKNLDILRKVLEKQ